MRVAPARKDDILKDTALRALARGADLPSAISEAARPGAGFSELSEFFERVHTIAQGTGPELARLLAEPDLTDLLINSTRAWADRGCGLEPCELPYRTDHEVRALAVRMAAACGKRLDDASPIVDGSLPGGIRLHAVLSPPSASGTLISLRTQRTVGMDLDQMEKVGSVSRAMGDILRRLVYARANVLVSGATGCGKTTLLAALLALVPPSERIVAIEEVPELAPEHPHLVSLVERRPNVQGRGHITLADLVRAAMRMRPDRLILGECRGPEVREVLLALNTGHDGGWATIHANGGQEVPARLHALGALAGMSDGALAAQAVAAFHALVHMRRAPKGRSAGPSRWVCEIAVLSRSGNELVSTLAIRASRAGTCEKGPAWDALEAMLESRDETRNA